MGASLSLAGISKAYRGTEAVCDVSLDVEPGEFLALLGPSGAGKTTTLRLIAGFEQPDTGDVRIGGRSMVGMPAYRRDIGLVFQHYALFPHMTVRDNVAFPLRMRRLSRAEIDSAVAQTLELVSLRGFEERRPAELSGGQQQRVAFARAIVFEPPLLLMDEPLAALDRKLREQLRVEVKTLQKRLGVTVVYVTHDQDEALSLADRVAIMNDARLEQVGVPRDIYERPATSFVAGFVGDGNFFEGRVCDCDDRGLVLETASGTHVTAAHRSEARPRTGDAVTCMVRPERVRFVGESEQPENALRGAVEEIFYFGQSATYRVSVEGADPMKVVVPARQDGPSPLPGDSCAIGWAAADGILLDLEPGRRHDDPTIAVTEGHPTASSGQALAPLEPEGGEEVTRAIRRTGGTR